MVVKNSAGMTTERSYIYMRIFFYPVFRNRRFGAFDSARLLSPIRPNAVAVAQPPNAHTKNEQI
jgi:hypothetical protein